MSTVLSDIITDVRDSHPAFDRVKVGNGLIARWASDYQRSLMQRAVNMNKQLVTAVMPISLIPSDDNTPDYAGAGQVGSLPADSASGAETVSPDERDAGYAVTVTEGAVAVTESLVTDATATSLSKTGAGWALDAYATNYMVKILRGMGAGQQRQIISNTSDTLVVDEWQTVPDDTSVFVIVAYTLDTGDHAVFTDFPLTEDRLAYVVRTDVNGNPYIDWTVPILAKIGIGIPLPQHYLPLGGTVYFDDGETDKLTIVGYQSRFRAPGDFPVYIQNNYMFLVGGIETWEEIASIEFRYVPVPPALTGLTSTLLLPDSARRAISRYCAYRAGIWCQALGIELNGQYLEREYSAAEGDFMQLLSQQRRARFTQLRG